MNAKELRKAAEYVRQYDELPHADYVPVEQQRFHEDAADIARHILSTVRDDDDEMVTHEWLASMFLESEYEDDYFTIGQLTVNALGDTSIHGWSIWCHEYEIADVKTRGQFRALCRGLGIELKEGE